MVFLLGALKLIPLVALLRLGAYLFKSTGNISTDPEDVKFYLYPFPSEPNNKQELLIEDLESLEISNFKRGEKTVFIIHGFWPNNTELVFQNIIKDAYLESNLPYNFIVVDWTKLVIPRHKNPLSPRTTFAYIAASDNVPPVAERITKFISFLVKSGYLDLDKVHMVGHSLGSHLAGLAAKVLNEKHPDAKVGRISGLDPAGPLFDGEIIQHHSLSQEDASFVDVYHTSIGTFGTFNRAGHVDFYPNSGRFQPGCKNFNARRFFLNRSLNGVEFICSHNYAGNMFAATISKQKYMACPCSPLKSSMLRRCNKCISDDKILAGEPCPTTARGQYYFETGSYF